MPRPKKPRRLLPAREERALRAYLVRRNACPQMRRGAVTFARQFESLEKAVTGARRARMCYQVDWLSTRLLTDTEQRQWQADARSAAGPEPRPGAAADAWDRWHNSHYRARHRLRAAAVRGRIRSALGLPKLARAGKKARRAA